MLSKIIPLFFLITLSVSADGEIDRGMAAYNKGNYSEAITFFKKSAEQGNTIASNNLGIMYERGEGVPKDDKQAVIWYRKAAEQGSANAQNALGRMYDYGRGVVKDDKEAVIWYRKAAEQSSASAQYNLGLMYAYGEGVVKDYKQAIIWYRKSAEQGSASAQYSLGIMYERGFGVNQDDEQAIIWYRKSAEQGNAKAQNNLGSKYKDGKGVDQDYKQALIWYHKAAEQGHADAQGNLGFMYANGQGVSKNEPQALTLYKKSNTNWSKIKYAKLKKQLDCKNDSKTKLFGIELKCANRDDLMLAVKEAGAEVKQENKNNWGDTYLTKDILKGSSQLTIIYTVDDFFAQAKYTLPSSMDVDQITNVRNFIANKYGEPDYSNGRTALGDVAYKWNLEDGIELKVTRGWPNTTTYLSFTYPENYQAMITEQEKQKKAREAKRYESQNNAF